jgi:NAD(P)-dependent dehydrogenase (short-subunit alcohol dehydrogenase family)
MELKPFGVHVVVIEPGAIRTEWGGIAGDSVLARSGDTAYAPQAKGVARIMNATEARAGLASPPEVVAKAIVRAVTSRRPRTRYAIGMGAKPIIFARAVLPDKGFDALMNMSYRIAAR